MKNKKPPADLFGQIAVTRTDIEKWIALYAPTISPRRRAAYIRAWNIADKVRAAIIAGTWPPPNPSAR